ncbi:zinc-finger domain-containing protein [Cucumibacter marinus]|uniref:zinc-finger domain-containing protein n=1 Tax=Cucumibacter marinus TaxID=1121252 RepID=UPI000417A4ED|nr:zinc-finger domain-containing protein [Cucumibacter marinus]
MAHNSTPHFHNTGGVARIEIGAREFKCVGALPPYDHPHVFLDMGDENEIVCPYCSTHYVYNAELDSHAAKPAEAVFEPERA